jgi:hypothetical protein
VDGLAADPALDAGMLERERAKELVDHLLQANDGRPRRNPARPRLYTRFTGRSPRRSATTLNGGS